MKAPKSFNEWRSKQDKKEDALLQELEAAVDPEDIPVVWELLRGRHGVEQAPSPKQILHYRLHPNGGLVFATAANAEGTDRTADVLRTAKTWGEVRAGLSGSGWDDIQEQLLLCYGDPEDLISEDGEGADVVRWDLDDTPFSGPEEIPGFTDGQPSTALPWLQEDMDRWLPPSLLEHFGMRQITSSGAYWHIRPELLERMSCCLHVLGYDVRDGSHLRFS